MQAVEDHIGFVEAAGLRWYVAVRRPAVPTTRTPLLLVNGIGASVEVLEPFVRHLPPELPVIRFDAPGVGRTALPARPFSLKGLARSVVELLDELGVGEFDVLGISWGGFLAQHIAAWFPQRCRRAVLVSTMPCVGARPARLDVLRDMLSRRRYLDRGFAVRSAGRLYGGALRRHPELVELLHDGVPGPSAGYLFQCLAGLTVAGPPFYPGIRQPTLILSGDDDPLIPLANARILRSAIPNSRLRIMHDGHLGLLTGAAELAPLVDSFIAREHIATYGRVESALYLTTSTARRIMAGRAARRPTSGEAAA